MQGVPDVFGRCRELWSRSLYSHIIASIVRASPLPLDVSGFDLLPFVEAIQRHMHLRMSAQNSDIVGVAAVWSMQVICCQPSPHLGRYWPALCMQLRKCLRNYPTFRLWLRHRGSDNQTLLSGICFGRRWSRVELARGIVSRFFTLIYGVVAARFHCLNSGLAICWIERTAVGILIICWFVPLSFVNLKCVGLCTVVC